MSSLFYLLIKYFLLTIRNGPEISQKTSPSFVWEMGQKFHSVIMMDSGQTAFSVPLQRRFSFNNSLNWLIT
jgi:hypothetical protein